VPEYLRTCTRGTRVPATGTDMRRVGYGFEKKIRLPVPALPAVRRGCTRAVPAVPAGKSLEDSHNLGWYNSFCLVEILDGNWSNEQNESPIIPLESSSTAQHKSPSDLLVIPTYTNQEKSKRPKNVKRFNSVVEDQSRIPSWSRSRRVGIGNNRTR
jgi:hypothetical protein